VALRKRGHFGGNNVKQTAVTANSHHLQGLLGSEQESLPGILGGLEVCPSVPEIYAFDSQQRSYFTYVDFKAKMGPIQRTT
jgi:hypothetical protein